MIKLDNKREGREMSRKRTVYSAEFKTKLVLEVLKEDKTLNEIASANNINPKNLQNWKKIFLENAEVAMEPAKAVKEYKEENAKLQAKLDEYAKTVGRLTVEKDWAVGKLKSLDSSYKKELIDRDGDKTLSVVAYNGVSGHPCHFSSDSLRRDIFCSSILA